MRYGRGMLLIAASILGGARATAQLCDSPPEEFWPVMFVSAGASPIGANGLTWATAFPTLEQALANASTTGAYDLTVYVRGGPNPSSPVAYAPKPQGSAPAVTDMFVIPNRVIVVGGFEGIDELELPDPVAHPTILSGNLGGGVYAEHVVTFSSSCATLWGFIIEDGRALGAATGDHDSGGGIWIVGHSPTIEKCVIRNNQAHPATGWGGGVYVRTGEPTFVDCEFEDNSASLVGGMAIEGNPADVAILSNCGFTGNVADGATSEGYRGGGLYIYDASPIVTGCDFTNNLAIAGGGAYVHIAGDKKTPVGPYFLQCEFTMNTARLGGGGGAKVDTGVLAGQEENDATVFEDCEFSDNRLDFAWPLLAADVGVGAGLSIVGGPELLGCRFVGNGPTNLSSEIESNGGGVAVFNYRPMDPGAPGGGDEYTLRFTAEFRDCSFRENGHLGSGTDLDFVQHGGGVYIQRPDGVSPFPSESPPSPLFFDATFENCAFIGNLAGNGGGAFLDRAASRFVSCRFMENEADGRRAHDPVTGGELTAGFGGGAVSNYRLSYIEVEDCKFVRNVASTWSGGAIYVYEGTTMNADRCYFVGNAATNATESVGNGGAIWVDSHCLEPEPTGGCASLGRYAICNVYNSLFVGNRAAEWAGALYSERAGRTKLVNCTIMNNFAGDGVGGVLMNSEDPAPCPLAPCETDQFCVTEVYNCILWGNTDGDEFEPGDQRSQLFEKQAEMSLPIPRPWPTAGYSCIQSTVEPNTHTVALYPGPGNNFGDDAVDHHPDIPSVVATGELASEAEYMPLIGQTKLTRTVAASGSIAGHLLRTFDSDLKSAWSLIVSNSDTEIYVLGDLTNFDFPRPFLDDFIVESYVIAGDSPCDAAGDLASLPAPFNGFDILSNDRTVGTLDMGCYENQDVPIP